MALLRQIIATDIRATAVAFRSRASGPLIVDTLYAVVVGEKLRLQVRDGARPDEEVIVLQGVLNAETAFQLRDSVRENESGTLVVDMPNPIRGLQWPRCPHRLVRLVRAELQASASRGSQRSNLGFVSDVQDRRRLHPISNGRRRRADRADLGTT